MSDNTGTEAANERRLASPLLSDQTLKLGLFGTNMKYGFTPSTRLGAYPLDWPRSLEVARRADAMGFELLIPLARWRGFGGVHDYASEGFETYTWASALAAATERIAVVATSHTYAIHPIVAAKQCVTVDHVSGGRFALNMTMGWFTAETEMFGGRQRGHDDRYAYGDEWLEICRRLWTAEEPFDFEGEYFTIRSAKASPLPLQRPWPVLIGAGASPAGRDFAARNVDISFVSIESLESAPDVTAQVRERAAHHGRELQVATFAHVIARNTEAEAWAAYEDIAAHVDWDATRAMMGVQLSQSQSMPETIKSQSDAEEFARREVKMAVGGGGYLIVGSYEQVTEALQGLSDAGIDIVTLTLPDYDAELLAFDREVMPLLREAGLRR